MLNDSNNRSDILKGEDSEVVIGDSFTEVQVGGENNTRWDRNMNDIVATIDKSKSSQVLEEKKIPKSWRNCCNSLFTMEVVRKVFPIVSWLPSYKTAYLRSDAIAGITVALTVIPQGLAYAAVAGLELQYGLYSAFIGCFIYCVLGTSKDITLGPTAIMSLLVAKYAHDPWQHTDSTDESSNVTLAILMTFTCGIIQILMSIFRLGFLVNFISHTVISGFTSAAAIVIACSQIKKILGIQASKEFFHMSRDIIRNIGDTNTWDLIMGVSCIVILFLLKKVKESCGSNENDMKEFSTARKLSSKFVWFCGTARNALVIIFSSAIAYGVTDLSVPAYERPLTLTPNISKGLPLFRVPSFTEPIPGSNTTASFTELLSFIGNGIAVIPLMGFLESIAIAQAFARKSNYNVRPTQELFAIGVSNFVGSFVGSYPVTGSFSRTAVNSQSHVATPLGGIFTGVLVLLSLQFITDAFQFIPSSSLAAVIIMAVINMFDLQTIKFVWKVNRVDLLPLIATFFICFWDLAYGIICGIGISLIILLSTHARPRIVREEIDNTVILRPRSGLDFPAAEYLENQFQNHITKSTCRVILDCSNITSLDFSAVEAVYHCAEKLRKSGVIFAICKLKPYLHGKLRKRGVWEKDVETFETVTEALENIAEKAKLTKEITYSQF